MNYSSHVTRDEEGFLVAGFNHRLTDADLKRWKEGDKVCRREAVGPLCEALPHKFRLRDF